VFPAESATRFTFRWQRQVTSRWWSIQHAATGRWNVAFRGSLGPRQEDTGAADFNDATPSPAPSRRIYIYDNPGVDLAAEGGAVGDFVHLRHDFIYRVHIPEMGADKSICSAIHVGQFIVARRIATTGTVATDWAGVENSTAIRHLSLRITQADVRAIVGGTDPIDIAAGANP
jgi:hypothetical protein